MIWPPVTILNGDAEDAWDAGFNARHNILGIKIWNGIDNFGAVLEQELVEYWFLRRWGLVFALPFIAACGVSAYLSQPAQLSFLFATLALLTFLVGPHLCRPLKRRMELIGHMAEWAVAVRDYGADPEAYLYHEARSLSGYRQFKGWTMERIIAAMNKWRAHMQNKYW